MTLTTSRDATPSDCQHTTPCHDCPWRREALPGWLGGGDTTQWLQTAHSETLVPCHTTGNQQCAGIAIYRANVLRKPRYAQILQLPPDRQTVFATPLEFANYHDSFGKSND